jgi:hypothetical protein
VMSSICYSCGMWGISSGRHCLCSHSLSYIQGRTGQTSKHNNEKKKKKTPGDRVPVSIPSSQNAVPKMPLNGAPAVAWERKRKSR